MKIRILCTIQTFIVYRKTCQIVLRSVLAFLGANAHPQSNESSFSSFWPQKNLRETLPFAPELAQQLSSEICSILDLYLVTLRGGTYSSWSPSLWYILIFFSANLSMIHPEGTCCVQINIAWSMALHPKPWWFQFTCPHLLCLSSAFVLCPPVTWVKWFLDVP